MSQIYASSTSSWRAKLPFLVVILFVAGIGLGVGARYLGLWGGSAKSADPNALTVTYTTESGNTPAWGVVNSPLRVSVNVPWSTGSQETVLSAVSLQLLDEAGKPATLGKGPQTEAFAMKPTFDISMWEWRGSVPSVPGKYHIRVQIEALYNKERNGTVDLPEPSIEARVESGPALASGFAFSQDANIWMLAGDASRQRRLTFFPEFYEYADKPAWSPDGKRIAFTYSPRTDPSQLPATDIWQVEVDGSEPKALVTHQEGESLLDPAWSMDAKYLYFTVDTSASTAYTNTTGTPGGALMGSTVRVDRVETATGAREQWMPSADMASNDVAGGDTVYIHYVQPKDNVEGLVAPPQRLMRADASGEKTTVLADENAFQMMYAPRMSPDGKWVVFAAINIPPPTQSPPQPSDTPLPNGGLDLWSWLGLKPKSVEAHGLPWDVYMVPAAGGQAIRLTKLDEDQPYPEWLDNSTIAFMGTTGLYELSIKEDGQPAGEPKKVHEGAPHGGLSWRGP